MFEEIIAKFSIINERPQVSSSRTQILSSIYINIPIPYMYYSKTTGQQRDVKNSREKRQIFTEGSQLA